jgi:hypothetical protein
VSIAIFHDRVKRGESARIAPVDGATDASKQQRSVAAGSAASAASDRRV